MPLRRFGSDAKSKDNEYAGLPKACRLIMTVADAGAVGFANCRFNVVQYNYGPFTVVNNATPPLFEGLAVGEPGIYTLAGQFVCGNLGAGGQYAIQFTRNGAPLIDGVLQHLWQLPGVAAGANALGFSTPCVELSAGDVIRYQYAQPGGGPVNTVAGYNYLMVTKEGGRY